MKALLASLSASAIFALVILGCSEEGDGGTEPQGPQGATETNVTPAPCDTDADCPTEVRCLHLHDDAGNEGPGFCEVKETSSTSSAMPAPCTVNADCGPSGACLHVHDESGAEVLGFCRTDNLECPRFCETQNEAESTVCQSDADCPGSRCGTTAACAF